ncbi:RNA polymerase sigma factor [Mesobacillus harenae]|uniref:RNA polymerase sigma factor n=1 Tax=Mesobacillus harenae TaxID=2213203 RepID=UPI001580E848|nr:RNA polymerase sigma factor [Mesobacillus harenae]
MADPLEEMYETYKKPIYNYLYFLCSNPHHAEELTHDTFLKAFKSFSTFRGESSIKSWLYRIARNTYLNSAKKMSSQMELSGLDETDYFSSPIDSDKKLIIKSVFKQLTEKETNLILLREHGFSYLEIAGILGLTEGKVKVGLHRAKKKFKMLYLDESEGSQ